MLRPDCKPGPLESRPPALYAQMGKRPHGYGGATQARAKKRSAGSSCVGHYARRGVVPARVALAITLSSSGREHGVIYPA